MVIKNCFYFVGSLPFYWPVVAQLHHPLPLLRPPPSRCRQVLPHPVVNVYRGRRSRSVTRTRIFACLAASWPSRMRRTVNSISSGLPIVLRRPSTSCKIPSRPCKPGIASASQGRCSSMRTVCRLWMAVKSKFASPRPKIYIGFGHARRHRLSFTNCSIYPQSFRN